MPTRPAHRRDGYKAHVATEPETGLVTECALTAANLPDGPTGLELLAGEQPGLEVLGDSAYGGGATRAALRAAGHSQTIKPLPLHSAVPGGFTIHDFRIDLLPPWSGARRATRCRSPARAGPASHAPVPVARYAGAAPPPRWRTIRVHPHEDELRAARRRAMTRSFQESYRAVTVTGMPDAHGLRRDLELAVLLGLTHAGGEQLNSRLAVLNPTPRTRRLEELGGIKRPDGPGEPVSWGAGEPDQLR